MTDVSYCMWSAPGEDGWKTGRPPFDTLWEVPLSRLHLLLDDPHQYAHWAAEYYERQVPCELVARVQSMEPLSPQMIERLNPKAPIRELVQELAEIGFPVAGELVGQGSTRPDRR